MTHHPSPVWTLQPQGRDSRSIAHSRMKTARNTFAARRCARLQSSMPTPGLERPRMMNLCESYSPETHSGNNFFSYLFSYFWMMLFRKNMGMVRDDSTSVVWAWHRHDCMCVHQMILCVMAADGSLPSLMSNTEKRWGRNDGVFRSNWGDWKETKRKTRLKGLQRRRPRRPKRDQTSR